MKNVVSETETVAAANQAARPLGRITAREINGEELNMVSGGTEGLTNIHGHIGDADVLK